MDPRVAGAGIAMALGLMLLLPTFNALNNSYMTDVAPPDWMVPDELPEDFEPPDDFQPPEDYEPPEDFEVPPGWEPPPDWEPPPGYDGPPPDCAPPVLRPIEGIDGKSWSASSATDSRAFTFEIPEYTIGLQVNITVGQGWTADRVAARLDVPDGAKDWSDSEASDPDQVPFGLQRSDNDPVAFVYNSTVEEDRYSMPAGAYRLTLDAPNAEDASFRLEGVMVLPCGGMMS